MKEDVLERDFPWPKITVVTPSYNQGQYLESTIRSVLDQHYPHLEYLVVDGGSTDDSIEIIRRYERHLTGWISEEDGGQAHAIEKGFAGATGELLNWINSDDLLFPGALRRIARAWMAEPRADLVAGVHASCDADGRITRISVPPCRAAFSPRCWIFPIGQPSTFFTRRGYLRVGGIRRDLHAIMDRELYYRMMRSGARLVAAKGLVGAFRYHDRGKTACRRDLWRREIPEFMGSNGISSRRHAAARCWMRLVRCIDGSYGRSWAMTRRLRGMMPQAVK